MRHPGRRFRQILVIVCLLAHFAQVEPTNASGEWERAPGSMTAFYADEQEVRTYVAAPEQAHLRAQAATFSVAFQDFPAPARASFEYAVRIWESLLVTPIPISIIATWEPLASSQLGEAGPGDLYRGSTTPWYPVALAQQILGEDLNPGEPDIVASFNSARTDWYFGTGQTPPGQMNFAMVVLHELGHGIGFTSSYGVASGLGGWGLRGVPVIYDLGVVDGNGASLLDTGRYPMPSAALASALQSNRLYFGGPKALAANNGNPARLHAPNPFEPGSSISHLDESTYPPGHPNSLMTARGSRGETNYNPGPLALGMLADLGWLLTGTPSPPPPSPAPPPPPAPPPAPPSAPPGGGAPACFGQTGKCVPPLFMAYWEAHGGLAVNGYPLTDARLERLEDGKEYFVQWFERVRMEHHPQNAPPNDVLLGQFGRLIHPADPPVPQAPGQAHFPQTGHNVPPDFMAFWEANGGLPQFGYPLSELLTETLEDGKRYQVQYFERARLERHPENAPPNQIQLGQFGRRILAGGGIPSPVPSPAPGPSPSPGGNVIFRDNFTDPSSGWPTDKHPEGHYESSYLPGEYRIALAAANYYAILTNRTIPPQANVRLEADMTRFGPVQEPFFGFACRAADLNNYYGAVIDTLGNALLFKFTGGRYVELARVQNHPAIRRGNATNRVRLDCAGTQLTLYANGTPLAGAQDGEFGGGQQGFLVYSFDKGGLDLHIRDFVASRP